MAAGNPHRWTPEEARELGLKHGRKGGRPPDLARDRTSTHIQDVLRGYAEIEARLVKKRWPATSPWWEETLREWYSEPARPALVCRVGRRGGKSTSLTRMAVADALYGHHDVPPGDTGFVAILSTDRKEAAKRLRTIKRMLDDLGVKWDPCEGLPLTIELRDAPIAFGVFTASIAGVSGFTSVFVLCDEVAKWRDEDTGTNPATEVLASVRPTMATMPNARIALSSSPMGILDAHYDAFEQGTTETQLTRYAPTWLANPSPETTEERTRALERDEAKWEREYAAIPLATIESSLVTEELVDRARRAIPEPWDLEPAPNHRYHAYMDPATRGNAWTLVVTTRGPDRRIRVALAREWRGSQREPLVPGDVFREMAGILRPYGTRTVRSDQWAQDALAEKAREQGLVLLTDLPWSATLKRDAYEKLKSCLQDRSLELHPDPQVKSDLLGIVKKVTRSGISYQLLEQSGRHSDYAPPLALAVLQHMAPAEAEEDTGAPAVAQRAKTEFLMVRERERKRQERLGGRMPATHRRY